MINYIECDASMQRFHSAEKSNYKWISLWQRAADEEMGKNNEFTVSLFRNNNCFIEIVVRMSKMENDLRFANALRILLFIIHHLTYRDLSQALSFER